jgi:hypothetical protein
MLPLWYIIITCVFAGLGVAQNYRTVKPVVISAAQATEHAAQRLAPKPRAQPHSLVYPDPTLTPCAANPVGIHCVRTIEAHDICAKGVTTKKFRHTTPAMKAEAYRKYGVIKGKGDCAHGCEVDHLIALEDGGADDEENLWPEPAEPRPGFHEKDHLETKLHTLVCGGQITLEEAQHEISSDWIAAYEKYVGPIRQAQDKPVPVK